MEYKIKDKNLNCLGHACWAHELLNPCDALLIESDHAEILFILYLTILTGTPSPPSLNVETRGDLSSLSFTIFPPVYALSCILHYIVTPISSNGLQTEDFTVAVNALSDVATVVRSGFDLCQERYNFTVGSLTRQGQGDTSDVISLDIVDFIGEVPGLT